MSLTIDLIEGQDAKLTDNGWEATRTAIVYGISDLLSSHEKIASAVTEVGISIGDIHPTFTTPAAYCREITPVAVTHDTVKIAYIYRTWANQSPTYSIVSNGAQEETNQLYNGSYYDDIQLEYEFPDDYPEQERAGKLEKTGIVIAKLVADMSIQITRHETQTLAIDDGAGGNPISGVILINRSKQYTGKVNTGVGYTSAGPSGVPDPDTALWNLLPASKKRTWLCTGITCETYDHGLSYDVTYSFSGRDGRIIIGKTGAGTQLRYAYGWDSHVVFNDPNTGKPVESDKLVWDTSRKIVQVYEEIDFSGLELS